MLLVHVLRIQDWRRFCSRSSSASGLLALTCDTFLAPSNGKCQRGRLKHANGLVSHGVRHLLGADTTTLAGVYVRMLSSCRPAGSFLLCIENVRIWRGVPCTPVHRARPRHPVRSSPISSSTCSSGSSPHRCGASSDESIEFLAAWH